MINGSLFLTLLAALGCAIIFVLIGIVLALGWAVIKLIFKSAKEAAKECSPVKDAKSEKSDATLAVKNTNANEQNKTE